MKTADYQKLRNAISDLQHFAVLLEEESKLYQRRLEDLWHRTEERPVTENRGVLTRFDAQQILALPATLVVRDNTQDGIIDVNAAVVLKETQLSEFVHENIDPRPRRANHLRQHLLRYFGKHL